MDDESERDSDSPFVGFKKLDELKSLIQTFQIPDSQRSDALSLLDSAALSFSSFVSDHCVKITQELVEQRERDKIVVLDMVPEQEHQSFSARNSADLALARAISDKLQLTGTIFATERLGKLNPKRPRKLKLFFLSRSNALNFLKAFHIKSRQDSTLSGIFARKSLSDAERKKEFELRQIAKERSVKEKVHFVVYAGEVVKKDDIPKIRSERKKENANPVSSHFDSNTNSQSSSTSFSHDSRSNRPHTRSQKDRGNSRSKPSFPNRSLSTIRRNRPHSLSSISASDLLKQLNSPITHSQPNQDGGTQMSS